MHLCKIPYNLFSHDFLHSSLIQVFNSSIWEFLLQIEADFKMFKAVAKSN